MVKEPIALRAIAKLAKKNAIKGANTACTLYFYQPKETAKIKGLRKF